jgi:hypothetical protein
MLFRKATWITLWERTVEFLFKSDIEYSEFQSCVMALLWGFWLAFNRLTAGFAEDGSLPQTLAAMKSLLPAWLWSIWFLLLGAGHMFALVQKSWTARRFFSFSATCTWLYVAIYLGLTNIRMIAVPTTTFFALGAAWGFWRLHSSLHQRTSC